MNRLNALCFFVFSSAILLAPSTAMQSSFGTPYVSSTYDMALGIDSSFSSQDTIRHDASLLGELNVAAGSGVWINQYNEVTSADGKATAATYAYMNPPGAWDYDFAQFSTKNSAQISETVKVTDAANMLFGGFACNQKDYAAVQVWSLDDRSASLMNYRNELFASNKEVRASQNFDAEDASLGMEAWANRGNKAHEPTDEDTIESIWNGGSDPGSHPSDALYDLTVSQYAEIAAGTVDSYSSSASIKSSKAEGSQSAHAIDISEAMFFSGAAKGVLEDWLVSPLEVEAETIDGDANWIPADVRAHLSEAGEVEYASKSRSTSSKMTASQTLDVQDALFADKSASAKSLIGDEGYIADSWGGIDGYYETPLATEAVGSLEGSDSAEARKGYVRTISDIGSTAASMSKGASTESWSGDFSYYADSFNYVDSYISSEGDFEVPASMKGSESATTKKNYALITSKLDASKAGSISRRHSASCLDGDFCFYAQSLDDVCGYISEDDLAKILASAKGSSSITAKKDYASIASDLDAKNAGSIDRWSYADSCNGELDYYAESWSHVESYVSSEDDAEILTSMKGKEGVISKKDYASAAQTITAKGAEIDRGTYAAHGDLDRGASASTYMFSGYQDSDLGCQVSQVPAAANSLTGTSTAKITAKSSSIKGSWKVYLAPDLTDYPEDYWATFGRDAHAFNDLGYAESYVAKASICQSRSFSFKESAAESSKDTVAA